MKIIFKAFFIVLFLLKSLFLFSQRTDTYTHPLFDSLTANHSKIAILPFDVTIKLRPALEKKIDPGELEWLEFKSGYEVQSALQIFFREAVSIKKSKIIFQNCSITDSIIMRNNWTIDSLNAKTKKELADTFGVDALISGTLRFTNLEPSISTLGAGIFSILSFDYYNAATDSVGYSLKIHDGHTDKLIWEYKRMTLDYTGGELGNAVFYEIIKGLMARARSRFPYKIR